MTVPRPNATPETGDLLGTGILPETGDRGLALGSCQLLDIRRSNLNPSAVDKTLDRTQGRSRLGPVQVADRRRRRGSTSSGHCGCPILSQSDMPMSTFLLISSSGIAWAM